MPFSDLLLHFLVQKKERIHLSVKDLNTKLHVKELQMNSLGKTFNNVFDFLMKVEGVKQVGQEKIVAYTAQNMGKFGGYYSRYYGHQAYPSYLI